MRSFLVGIAILLAVAGGYLAFWPVPIEPVAYTVKPPQPITELSPGTARWLAGLEKVPVGGRGPEDVVRRPGDGALFTGLEDGRILKLIDPFDVGDGNEAWSIETFANTGGRPLGLAFDAAGTLIVADGKKGLLSVAADGQVTTLSTEAAGAPIRFADELAIASNGVIWFTDASARFDIEDNLLEFFEARPTGRLLTYDPATGETAVNLDGLGFANGVAFAGDESYVLVAETLYHRVTRLWLTGENAGTSEVFAEGLPGYPDNLTPDGRGGYWVALAAPRSELLDSLADKPWARKVLLRLSMLPGMSLPVPAPQLLFAHLGYDGHLVGTYTSKDVTYVPVTTVYENGSVYFGSIGEEAIGVLRLMSEDEATE